MVNRRRVAGALLALIVPAVTALSGVTTATAATPDVPPGCAWDDPSAFCVHAPTPDIVALPSPTFTTSFDAKTNRRTVIVNATITPAYPACPPGPSVPFASTPCAEPGLNMTARVYVPGATTLSGAAGTPVSGVACDFSCPMTFTLDPNYYGPGTVILKFSVGDVLHNQGNQLFISSYETTITLPSDPFKGAFHVTKPRVAYSGKMKTMTLKLGGKGQIPKSGVGGVVVLLSTKGEGQLHGGDLFSNQAAVLEVIPGTAFAIKKLYPGATTVTTLGWYEKGLSDTGDLIHTQYANSRVHVGKTIALHAVGVPLNATGALLVVTTPNGPTKIAGVLVPASQFSQFVLVPLSAGAKASVKAAKGAIIAMHGWTAPVQAVDDGFTVSVKKPSSFPG